MSQLQAVDAIHCDIGEMLTVLIGGEDRIYVTSHVPSDPDSVHEPVLMLTADEAHALGTKLRLAAKKAGRS